MWSRKRWNSEGMCFSSIRCSYFSFIMPTCSWKKNQTKTKLQSQESLALLHISRLIIPGTQTLSSPSTVSTLFSCLLSKVQGGWALQAEVEGESGVRSLLDKWPTSFQGFYSLAQKISRTTPTCSFILFTFLISNPIWPVWPSKVLPPPVFLKAPVFALGLFTLQEKSKNHLIKYN